jgi:drug/metabolite transporter (DMT)-like permease
MFYLLIASLIWAFSYGLVKYELCFLDPNFVTVCRMFAAFLVFLPFFNLKKNKRLIPHLMLIGAIQYGAMYLLMFNAYHYLEVYQVILFSAMTPFYIILIHSLTDRKFNLVHFLIATISIVAFSIFYKIQGMNTNSLWGFILVQCSDICFAFGQMTYRKLKQNHFDIQDREIYSFLFLGAFLTAVVFTSLSNGWEDWNHLTWRQIGVLIYLGTVASGLCFFWWNKGITQLHPVMISVFNNIKLFLATLVSLWIFHAQDEPSLYQNNGLFLMIIAIALAQYYQYHYNISQNPIRENNE